MWKTILRFIRRERLRKRVGELEVEVERLGHQNSLLNEAYANAVSRINELTGKLEDLRKRESEARVEAVDSVKKAADFISCFYTGKSMFGNIPESTHSSAPPASPQIKPTPRARQVAREETRKFIEEMDRVLRGPGEDTEREPNAGEEIQPG